MDYPTLLMETDVGAVAPGGTQFGWVSGSPANLAASGNVTCLFDLGPNWSKYAEVQVVLVTSGASSGLNSIVFTSRDDAVASVNTARQLGPRYSPASNGSFYFATVATGAFVFNVRPMGRYFVTRMVNADAANPQGATSKVTIAAYAD